MSARPTTREKLAGLLREDEAWIAWAAAKDRMLALCVRRNTRVVVDVGPLAAIDADVARWRRALGTPGANDIEVARRLHETLIGPLRPYLGGTRRLLVSPEGSLASVPLGALVTPAGPKPRRLVESVEVLHVPSATSYAILVGDAPSKPTGGALITVAAPNYEGTGLPALPHAAREAGLVARPFQAERRVRFHGDKAALGPLLQYLEASAGSLRALHVAAHAFTDPEHPERNGIVLARGEMLSVDRVRRLRMPCDLVVLSCCDSARGTPTAGEGHRGLVRAFLLAGARRVIASCWRVADAETPALMGHLYKAWETEGLSASAALRAAQLERLRAGGKLAHPYYWAPFVAWGLP